MATEQDIRNFTATVEDAVTYPILTRETTGYASSNDGANGSNAGISLAKVAKQTIRSVLGWRFRAEDPKGFLAALKKAFALKEIEGHIEWDYKPQSYALQADLGEITGAQASIHKQATVALEHALPLLDGLKPLRADADEEDSEAMRAIIRTELNELVNELAIPGGPRTQRVDSFFEKLIGTLPPASFDPEKVAGQLRRLRERFGLTRARVNTVFEEQNLTNFLILVDYVNSLYQSWETKRAYFAGTAEPFLGTQLVLLSQVLDAILEQLRETYDAMDSVFFGPAERQTTEIELSGGAMSVAELLGWVETFAAVEGRQLIQDAGKDGVVLFRSTIERLEDLVREAGEIASQPSTNPARPFHTKRVANSLMELATYLSSATDRAKGISRNPIQFQEILGGEENLPPSGVPFPLPTKPTPRVYKLEVPSAPGDPIVLLQGDEFEMDVFGLNLPSLPSFLLGEGVTVTKQKFISSEHIRLDGAIDGDAKVGWRNFIMKTPDKQVVTLANAFMVSEEGPPCPPPLNITDVEPNCGRRGETLCVKVSGEGFEGAGVSFGDGIRVQSIEKYEDDGMRARIQIDWRARLGPRSVDVVAADCRHACAKDAFRVAKESPSPLIQVAYTKAAPEPDPCEDEEARPKDGHGAAHDYLKPPDAKARGGRTDRGKKGESKP